MSHAQTYREVDIPRNFDQWGTDAQVNYLCNAMNRADLTETLRELHEFEQHGSMHLRKDELAELVADQI